MMLAMSSDEYLYSVEDHIATITLNRPDSLNSLTFDLYRSLRDRFVALQEDASVKVVMLTGQGRGFCSGGSVHEIIAPLLEMDATARLGFTRLTGELILAIRKLRKPVIAALNGICVGAGAVMALACDFRITSTDAKIAFLFVKVGLAGADMGAAWLLPQMVGLGRATDLLLRGEKVTADEALQMGLVHRVVPKAEVLSVARQLALELSHGPTFALGMTKEMLNREPTLSLESALEAEAQAQQICMATQDFREAKNAFIEKRTPRFFGQ